MTPAVSEEIDELTKPIGGIEYRHPEEVFDMMVARIKGRLSALSTLAPSAAHTDDLAVNRFAEAMKAKLKWERVERDRYGWDDPNVCTVEYLADQLIKHLAKGNPGTFEDVANFAMMLHQRGADPKVLAALASPAEAPGVTDDLVERGWLGLDEFNRRLYVSKEDVRVILEAALASPSAEAVQPAVVKVLEWREWKGDILGRAPYMIDYRIVLKDETAHLEGVGDFLSVDEAKAAAQTDYEARIRAALASPSAEAAQPVAEPVEWLWFGEAGGEQHISFGRWQNHKSQYRYKYADIQATEHDHHAQSQGELREGMVLVPREPTPEMLGAWYRYKNGHRWPGEEPAVDTSDVGAYRAMLDAALAGRTAG